jgi:hypothetical protein
MHDIDRTQLEAWETGYDTEYDTEYDQEYETEYDPEYEADAYEYDGEAMFEGPFSEVEEMELASDLLEVASEEELDQFLGNIFKKVSRAAGTLIKGPLGAQLKGLLKNVAKKALPIAGGALGSVVPGLGTAVGAAAGSSLANLFELELEGLSAEDQEFEIARRYVRLAGEVAQQAAQAPQGVPPQEAAKTAMIAAAQQHAPGLLRQAAPPKAIAGRRARSGRWIRRGRAIILLGA